MTRISVDPLQQDPHGVAAPAGSLQVEFAAPAILAPGDALTVTLGGLAPAQPGTYLSTVRLYPDAGPPVTVPLQLKVAASSAWGLALTLLGLCVVSAMAGLDEQGAVATKLREALHRRGEAQAFVAQYPEPEGGHTVPAMDRAYEAAITALSRPRSAGLRDHRLEDAAAPLAEADALAASLRKAAANLSPADALVATAETPWKTLQPQLHALAAPLPPGATPNPGTTTFDSRLDAAFARLRDRLVGAPARWLEGELTAQLTQLRLIAAAGEMKDAGAQARAVQAAIRRAARTLADAQRLVMRQLAQSAFLLGTVADIQSGLADADLPAASRADIAAKLDAAQAALADGTDFRRFVDVSRNVSAAETALTLARSQVHAAKIKAAVDAGSAETDQPDVDQALAAAQADPDKSPATKAAHLRAIVAAWRSTIGRASDPSARPALLARVDAVATALDRGDSPAIASSYRELTTAWAAYGAQRINAAAARALKPFCDDYATRLQRRLGFIGQELQWEDPNANSADWDRRRDRLRLAIERVAPDGDCLGTLLALDKDASLLAAEIAAAAADTAGVDAAVRLEAMAVFGVPASAGPRALTPLIEPPDAPLLVDRRLAISVGDLDPAWRMGTLVSIDFGDGTPPLVLDVEKLRQAAAEHVYARPLSAHVTVLAADAFTPDGHQALGTLLGHGEATFLIAPAPDSEARILADRFLSARFALALIVTLAIYSWRFQARDRVFGARGLDYAEAFILGFTVNAAISGLPAELAKLLPG